MIAMKTKNYDCSGLAQIKIDTARDTLAHLKSEGVMNPIVIDVVELTSNPDFSSFVKAISTTCDKLGIECHTYGVDPDNADLVCYIADKIARYRTHGVVIARPPYNKDNYEEVKLSLDYLKDCIAFSVDIDRMLRYNLENDEYPAVVEAVHDILEYEIGYEELSRMNAVIIGSSPYVGDPMASMLIKMVDSVSTIHMHSDPNNISKLTENADIIVTARTLDDLIIPEDAVVVDLNGNKIYDRLYGKIKSCTTNIGKLTVANLIQNAVNNFYEEVSDWYLID